MNTPQEFAELAAGLRRLEAAGFAAGAALATITRTRGSTFRRAGARMLVCGDGTIVRGLAGGCPERDIVARAHEVIATQCARVVRYDREQNLDAMLEMGCGGELEILIEPIAGAADLRFVAEVERCLKARADGVLATVFARTGTILPRPRRLVWAGAARSDDLADSALTQAVEARLTAISGNDRAQVERIEAGGATHDVLLERLQPPHALLIVGAGAGAVALARVAAPLGWVTTLVRHRDDQPAPALPDGARLLTALPGRLRDAVALDRHTSCVVMTHDLERDIDYLRVLSDAPLGYLGAIGSRSRAAKLCEATGLAPPRLHAPAGLDVGSETPEEIALAIAAQILAVMRARGGGALSATGAAIH